MLKRFSAVLVHVFGLVLVCVIGAYSVIRVVTPAPSVAPAPLTPAPPRDPDPVLAARMFGKVQAVADLRANLQLVGVFAAGAASSAAISVDGKPARVYLVGQEVADGLVLSTVRGDGVSLTGASGVSQELQVPQRASASFASSAAPPVYRIDRGIMTAPSVEGAPPAAAPPGPPPGQQP